MAFPLLLGVNIDHIATLRQARGTLYPDPVQAAFIAEQAGADGITVHLREDKRHIQPRDVLLLKQTLTTRMNLEMAVTEEMLTFACQIQPEHICLVPEKREELTTEGGLDAVQGFKALVEANHRLLGAGCEEVSLFIDADKAQIQAAADIGVAAIELHTGAYADAQTSDQQMQELERLQLGVKYALSLGLKVNAGHGLHYHNVQAIAGIAGLHELNIGHAIIARAVLTGLHEAVATMKALLIQHQAR
ncbi:pyridoxine 5-phosphate synthase [Allopseudospirillum japonicum]|uniref:Pyridoxine 5'-phosphate synthase n=1 Tax=Allopseudospirillum japonicum TaxID=64971 RepID=A0A1H6Q1K3_9GAMM|nr:pyridoxine 5'-phosphate synthase [Allopseudospirillum japonicum]SEI37723.1 pyridoxine 5-phosphate synthase [Allopseudospirillum japonicum]